MGSFDVEIVDIACQRTARSGDYFHSRERALHRAVCILQCPSSLGEIKDQVHDHSPHYLVVTNGYRSQARISDKQLYRSVKPKGPMPA